MEVTFIRWVDVSTLHCPALGIKARPKPKLRDRKSLNFQDTIGRPQEIEVEEVETVETVEATGGTARTQRQRFLYRQEKADINRGLMLKVPRSDKSRRVRRTILKACKSLR